MHLFRLRVDIEEPSLYTILSNNVFFGEVRNNVMGFNNAKNTIGHDFYNNDASDGFEQNLLGRFYFNSCGKSFSYNVGEDCFENIFADLVNGNAFGVGFQGNSCGIRMQANTFGNASDFNNIGAYFQSNLTRYAFNYNDVGISISSIDFVSSSIVSELFNKQIIKAEGDTIKVVYIDNLGDWQIVGL